MTVYNDSVTLGYHLARHDVNAGLGHLLPERDALVAERVALVDRDDGRRHPGQVGLGREVRPGQRVGLVGLVLGVDVPARTIPTPRNVTWAQEI